MRILTQIANNEECSVNLNISSLKLSLNRFKNRRRKQKQNEKFKANNEEIFKKNQAQRRRKCDKKAKH